MSWMMGFGFAPFLQSFFAAEKRQRAADTYYQSMQYQIALQDRSKPTPGQILDVANFNQFGSIFCHAPAKVHAPAHEFKCSYCGRKAFTKPLSCVGCGAPPE